MISERLPELDEKVRSRLECIVRCIVEKEKFRSIYLFGSLSKGATKPKGFDLDLLICPLRRLSFREKRLLREEVEEVAGIYTVDLLFEDEVSPEFLEKIRREGLLLYAHQG